MRLQSDPTVIYGLGQEFDGDLTRQQLQALTPYGTYRIMACHRLRSLCRARVRSLPVSTRILETRCISFLAGTGPSFLCRSRSIMLRSTNFREQPAAGGGSA